MAIPLRTGYEQASYIVYIKDGGYYAKHGRTGDIAFGGPNNMGGVSGSDAAAVIQAAINATFAEGGGSVFLKKGNYYLTSALTLPNTLALGEDKFLQILSDGAILSVSAAVAADVISLDAVSQVNYSLVLRGFHIYPASRSQSYYGIRIKNILNLYIDNVTLGWEGLKVDTCSIVYLSSLYLVDTTNDAIYLTDCSYVFATDIFADNVGGYGGVAGYNGILISNCNRVFFKTLRLFGQKGSYGGQENGIYISNSSYVFFSDVEIDGFKKSHVFIASGGTILFNNLYAHDGQNCAIEISATGPVSNVQVSNFEFTGDALQRGLAIWAQNTHNIRRVRLEGGIIHDLVPGVNYGVWLSDDGSANTCYLMVRNVIFRNLTYGISEGGKSDYNLFENNVFDSVATPIDSLVGGHSYVRRNEGYVTENRGIAVMAAGGAITVTHHMDAIPVVINVTAQGDLGDVYVPGGDKITVTGFTIVADTPVAGVSVFWEAYAKSTGMWLFW